VEKDAKKRAKLLEELAVFAAKKESYRQINYKLKNENANLERTIEDNKKRNDKVLKEIVGDEKALRDLRDKKVEILTEISKREKEVKNFEKRVEEDQKVVDLNIINSEELIAENKRKNEKSAEYLADAKEIHRKVEFEEEEIEKIKEETRLKQTETIRINARIKVKFEEIEAKAKTTAEYVEDARKMKDSSKSELETARALKEEYERRVGLFKKNEEEQNEKTRLQIERDREQDARDAKQDAREQQQNREVEEIAIRKKEAEILNLRVLKLIKDKEVTEEYEKLKKELNL